MQEPDELSRACTFLEKSDGRVIECLHKLFKACGLQDLQSDLGIGLVADDISAERLIQKFLDDRAKMMEVVLC